jgi:hypothetical protein
MGFVFTFEAEEALAEVAVRLGADQVTGGQAPSSASLTPPLTRGGPLRCDRYRRGHADQEPDPGW